ncbi:MAG TPA: two-component regulator propeller domain-containing protein, partial [Candidatus Polarisedimenticolia bacterium]|nr:two-component regulator propeller domain-containing protein [Candidatus Polarisedimenticolia bacterium]
MITRKGCVFLAVFSLLTPLAWGQRYSDWRIYRASDGMAESPCVSVTVSANEKVLTKHINTNSISELDGYTITSFPSPEIGRNRVYGSPGGQLWTAVPEGLEEFRNGTWRLHPLHDFDNSFRGMIPAVIPPIPLHVTRQSHVLVLLPDRLMEFNGEDPDNPRTTILRLASQSGLKKFLGMTIARDGGVWISGARGLEHTTTAARNLKPTDDWQEFPAPTRLDAQNFQQPLPDINADGITCVAESLSSDQKIVAHFDGTNWISQTVGTQKLRGAWREADGITWVVTLNALFQIDNLGSPSAEIEELGTGHYFDLALQTNGVFWIASAEGLLRYSPPLWKSPRALQHISAAVPCVAEDSESRLWFASAGELHSLENGVDHEHPFYRQLRPVLQGARALLPLKNGDLLLDAGEQLYQFQPFNDTLNPVEFIKNDRQHTLGLFRDGSAAVEITAPGQPGCSLKKYDGTSFQPFPADPPDCGFNAFLETQNGDIWLGGDHGAVWFHDKKWQTFTNNGAPNPIVSFVETAEGKVWAATPDAIWEYSGQWNTVRSGFDQINSIIRSHDGAIWVASNGGVSRFAQGTWIDNSIEEGLPNATARQVYEDHRGRIWVATTRGLTLFHPEADADPPLTRISRTPEGNSIPQSALVNFVFNGEDKWKYTPRNRLLYSYRLDQHEWSQFVDMNNASYPELPAGSHSLEVRAMDRNGNIEEQPAHMAFTIALPWYKETRLVLISFIGMITALFFAALAFNRHRKLLRSYAEVERKVAERTRELEITSRELVHSQKMNALGTLAAGIAHDFNSILSIIKGSAQIIEENLDNPQKVSTRVDRIKTVVEQGSGIVRAM